MGAGEGQGQKLDRLVAKIIGGVGIEITEPKAYGGPVAGVAGEAKGEFGGVRGEIGFVQGFELELGKKIRVSGWRCRPFVAGAETQIGAAGFAAKARDGAVDAEPLGPAKEVAVQPNPDRRTPSTVLYSAPNPKRRGVASATPMVRGKLAFGPIVLGLFDGDAAETARASETTWVAFSISSGSKRRPSVRPAILRMRRRCARSSLPANRDGSRKLRRGPGVDAQDGRSIRFRAMAFCGNVLSDPITRPFAWPTVAPGGDAHFQRRRGSLRSRQALPLRQSCRVDACRPGRGADPGRAKTEGQAGIDAAS